MIEDLPAAVRAHLSINVRTTVIIYLRRFRIRRGEERQASATLKEKAPFRRRRPMAESLPDKLRSEVAAAQTGGSVSKESNPTSVDHGDRLAARHSIVSSLVAELTLKLKSTVVTAEAWNALRRKLAILPRPWSSALPRRLHR